MKIRGNLVGILLLFMIFSNNVIGQSVTDATVMITPIHNSDTTVYAKFNILVSDTTDISQIAVELGSSSGIANLISTNFNFDSPAPSPYTYFREGNHISLDVGIVPLAPFYFARVRIKMVNGLWSNPSEFVFN